MTWIYHQSTGQIIHDGEPIGIGYAGHGNGLNNPLQQDIHNVGPIPCGNYAIHMPFNSTHMGPFVMYLEAHADNQMFGRTGFYMHGDTIQMNHTASDGCIIASRAIRTLVATSNDTKLVVVP